MKKLIAGISAVSLVFALALLAVVPVFAAPATGTCVQAGHDFIVGILDSPNDTEGGSMGDAIADGLFGNEPNLVNTNTNDDLGPEEVLPGSSAGFVVGSSSPGPHTIGGGFLTWGSIIHGSVPASCL